MSAATTIYDPAEITDTEAVKQCKGIEESIGRLELIIDGKKEDLADDKKQLKALYGSLRNAVKELTPTPLEAASQE